MYRAVLEAQLAAIDAVRAGARTAAVDAAARQVFKGYGLDRAFMHSTGHGLGLEIHEPPRLGRKDKMRLQAGMAITIEPGVYLEGFGGIRIEDTVVVTDDGLRDPDADLERTTRHLGQFATFSEIFTVSPTTCGEPWPGRRYLRAKS